MTSLYTFLDYFFIVFHTVLIIFNVFGWIWQRTRKLNLVFLLLTGASWTILGIFYGFGYCPLTDWHFAVLRKLGQYNLPSSYIKYLVDRLFGLDLNAAIVDKVTLIVFLVALAISLFFNFRHSLPVHRK
ncbi:MAG: DUF2784 domain-containing protein [Bacteroidota bacterium]|nr:DUF2784 domain-containing protein [Bacteroidota bacterium]